MENPTMYIFGSKECGLIDLESFEIASNLDYAKKQCITQAMIHGTQIIYKLVPVFEASVEVVTKVIEKDLTKLPPPDQRPAAEEEGSW